MITQELKRRNFRVRPRKNNRCDLYGLLPAGTLLLVTAVIGAVTAGHEL